MTFIDQHRRHRPLYIFAKPQPDVARLIDRTRRMHGIAADYAPELLHITLARFGDYRNITRDTLRQINRAVTSLHIERCSVSFDTIRNNMLIGHDGLSALRAEQRALLRRLDKHGVPIQPSSAQPHVSLSYKGPIRPDAVINPIGWQIEELLLVVSHHGQARHKVLQRWPLTTRQITLPFAV